MTYTQKTERLEEILRSLQKGSISLEESLSLYEEAQKLLEECRAFLRETEGKITYLPEDQGAVTKEAD